jgi:hypothetical protein
MNPVQPNISADDSLVAELSAAILPPARAQIDNLHNPMATSHWSHLMVLVWIITRDIDAVREWSGAYRAAALGIPPTFGELLGLRVATLQGDEPSRLAQLLSAGALNRALRDLWDACGTGQITGLDGAGNAVSADVWPMLKLGAYAEDRFEGPAGVQYSRINFRRLEVLAMWKPETFRSNGTADEAAQMAAWVKVRIVEARHDPYRLSVPALWREWRSASGLPSTGRESRPFRTACEQAKQELIAAGMAVQACFTKRGAIKGRSRKPVVNRVTRAAAR